MLALAFVTVRAGEKMRGMTGWIILYVLIGILTLIFQIDVRTPECDPNCGLSYTKAIIWSAIWPASWVVYLYPLSTGAALLPPGG